jgi:hypothetical protein
MRLQSRWIATPLFAAAVLALGGCGAEISESVGKPPTDNTVELDASNDKISVSGSVTVGGKALTGGDVIFDAKTSSRSSIDVVKSPIGKDGSYTAKTHVGTNHISVSAPDLTAAQKAEVVTKILQPSDSKVDVTVP